MIQDENLQENSREVGTYLLLKLAKLRDEFDIVGDVRGKGLMIGIEMVKDKVGSDWPHSLQLTVARGGCKLTCLVLSERAHGDCKTQQRWISDEQRESSIHRMLAGCQEFRESEEDLLEKGAGIIFARLGKEHW